MVAVLKTLCSLRKTLAFSAVNLATIALPKTLHYTTSAFHFPKSF